MQRMQQQLAQQHQMQQQQNQVQQASAHENGKELEKVKAELQAACSQRDQFQKQLELLVQELEKSQVGGQGNLFIIKPYVLIVIIIIIR